MAIEQTAAQSDDGVCAAHGPEHAGQFEAATDHSFAAGLNDAGADEQVLLPEFGIAHAVPVAVEVFGLDAFGFVLIKHTANRTTGYTELAQFIDGVPTSPDAAEFLYQINRPRASKVLPEVLINRLSRWSVANYVAFTLDLTVQQYPMPAQRPHLRLELDISTTAARTETIPADQVPNLVKDLLDGAKEISEHGNRF